MTTEGLDSWVAFTSIDYADFAEIYTAYTYLQDGISDVGATVQVMMKL